MTGLYGYSLVGFDFGYIFIYILISAFSCNLI